MKFILYPFAFILSSDLAVVEIDSALSEDVLDQLRKIDAVILVKQVRL